MSSILIKNTNSLCIMIFGERLELARKAAGLSQSALARAIGVTPSAISQIEAGGTKKPSSENLLPIADALDVNTQWLISGNGPMKPVHDIRHAQQVLARRQERQHDEAMEPESDAYCTAQWEIDAIKALRGMDDDRRRRALQDLEDGAELERLQRAGSHD